LPESSRAIDGGLRHVAVAHQRRLDLARLDAEAAQLHLRIGTPEEVEHPVGAPACEIAGAIHAAADRPERIRYEALRGQPGAAEIAARQPSACNIKLTRYSSGHRLQTVVQHISAIIGERTADRNARFVGDAFEN